MNDKTKTFAMPAPKNAKPKRPSTVSATPSTSRTRIPNTAIKEKNVPRPKISKHTSVIGDGDVSVLKHEGLLSTFDDEQRQVAYSKFLRAMLEDCLVDEKIEREESQMDIQMGHLADRFQKTIEQMDLTNRRMRDINFVVEQKRLLALKNQHCDEFYTMTEESKAEDIMRALNKSEQSSLDKLHTKNIDFGYNKESGHKQLLDAVNDAIEGLDQIKKFSKLDIHKFKEYEKMELNIDALDKDRLDLESLKADFDKKFPQFSEGLLRDASEKIKRMIMSDDELDEDD